MHTKFKQMCLLLLCVFAFVSCTMDNELTEIEPATNTANLTDVFVYSKIETEILQAVNDYRVNNDLKILSRVDGITYEAYNHNLYMIENKKVSHENFQKRYTTLKAELGATSVSENIGYGYRTAGAVVDAWIKSDGHRENIKGDFTHFGVSVEQDEEGKNYFTQIFIKR